MADIFISYARADRDRIEKLSQALEGEGYSVWWDRHIESGAEFSKDIERELAAAKAVIVCWSEEGSNSRWVKDEANIAAEAGKLLAVTLDADLPPIGFRQYHAVDFSKWKGDGLAPAYIDLSRAIKGRIIGDTPPLAEHSIVPPETKGPEKREIINPKALAGVFAAVVVAFILSFILMRGGDSDSETVADATTAQTVDRSKSIAVLPFADFSPASDQEWFSDGLTEEILNALARTPDLLVASRTSSFKYKETDEEIPVIAKRLGVEHVLEGSVRRAGDRLRVTAQLIRASDGFHLWSQNYDRTADDVIAIQEDIALEIAKALKTAMDPKALAEMVNTGTRSVDAYEAYLEGLALRTRANATTDSALFTRANQAFERARTIDPAFAEAHANAALFWMLSFNLTLQMPILGVTPEAALQNVLDRIDLAIAVETDETIQRRHKSLKASALSQYRNAVADLEAYVRAYPNDVRLRDALTSDYIFLGEYEKGLVFHRETEAIAGDETRLLTHLIGDYVWLGAPEDAARLSRRVLALAPDNVGALYQAQRAFLWAGAKEEAHQAAVKYRRLNPEGASSLIVEIRDACAAGDRLRAERAADQIFEDDNVRVAQKWHAYNLLARKDEANRLVTQFDRPNPPHQIQGFLPFPYFDAVPFPNISKILEREGVNRRPPVEIPFACPAVDENATDEKSIAVLPFVALSNDDSDEYFGKGMAEELLNALAQFPELKVAARTSAFSFDGQNVDLREVGETLGVAHVLEGSVRRAGTQIRVTAQLIRTSDGFHLWSETYERELTDIFDLQDEIVREILRNLQIRLGVGGGTGRAEAQSVDPHAYEQYLRGLTLWGNRDNPVVRRNALSAFLLATELDPDFADAWAMIGMVGARSGFDLIGESAETYNTRTEEAFEHALRLDPDNPITLAAMVAWHARHDIDIINAKKHLDRVLALAPSMADTQYSASLFYSTVGDNAASLRAVEQAIAVDPLNPTLRRTRATELVIAGRASEAFDYFNECAAQDCINPLFLSVIALGSALVAGDRQELSARYRTFEGVMNLDQQIAQDFEPLHALVLIELGEDQTGEAASLLRDAPLHPGWLPFVGPRLVEIGADDKFFDLLFLTHRDKALFAQPFSLSHYYPTANQFPGRILRDARYHEFWALPGMPELAAARRANGRTEGLPLPMDASGE